MVFLSPHETRSIVSHVLAAPPQIACLATCLIAALMGCSQREPFAYFPACGTVSYEDGSLLSADRLVLSFHPVEKMRNGRSYPRPASALVDSKTGKFSSVTSHKPGDGLMACQYKVTLHQPSRLPLPPEVADEVYGDLSRTPLEIEGGKPVIDLRIHKPAN